MEDVIKLLKIGSDMNEVKTKNNALREDIHGFKTQVAADLLELKKENDQLKTENIKLAGKIQSVEKDYVKKKYLVEQQKIVEDSGHIAKIRGNKLILDNTSYPLEDLPSRLVKSYSRETVESEGNVNRDDKSKKGAAVDILEKERSRARMAQWNGSSESGILRKNVPTGNHDELLVFGYACKLFRDDEKALYIDQGKHLIPWAGDEKLKIDRYDCRGALADISKYEASKEGFDAMRWLGLSDREINLEQLCDKERYYSLEINEEEEEMYKEEEQKRKKTNAVQYSYDVPQKSESKSDGIPTVPEEDEVEEEYIPPPILDVPVDIEMPKTVKENARIEKTALFVCRQGPQMEILIKAKQSDNPQFGFLNQGDPLYKFYRHVLAAFKNGRYRGYEPKNKDKTDHSGDGMVEDSSNHYLHPSLISTNPEPVMLWMKYAFL
ncbi:hypothetical protein JTB14_004726 [Gonioctena quinquepunctata]|nr:hypothetical protein JTB14_004726 [Gonioctena quinquepunctata]